MTDLTTEEQVNVRTALRFLRARTGGWNPVAKALGMKAATLRHALDESRAVTARVAFRVARLAGVAIEDVLDGTYPSAGTCPHCGHPPEDFAELTRIDGADPRDGLKLVK